MKWPLAKSSMPVDVLSKLSRPQIRIFDVPETTSLLPVADLPENWKVLTPETAPAASAVACYFAMKLQDELDVPVGMFCAAWNASHIEPWTAVAGFDEIPETKRFADKARSKAPDAAAMKAYLSNVKSWIVETEHALDEGENVTAMPLLPRYNSGLSAPAAMFNGMIHPLAGYAMRGAIWYQGESNIGDKGSYEAKLRALIAGWRKAWGQGAFPFYFVQLPPYAYDGIGEFWEAQFHVFRSMENVGMAVTTDIGEMNNLHPANKKDVGERLALWALAKDYGRKLVYSGPLYKGYEIKGNTMVVAFDHAESGLACKGEEVTDVFIKGEGDASFVKALAKMEGSKLIIGHPDGRKPLHVRMGWNKNALPNLMNKEGLPASPFRTDQDE
jgi:sialate O-acetylesterase